MKNIPIILAPMQGYADFVMRQILTEMGGFDEVVSEFVRITHTVHSPSTWLKKVPELKNNAKTQSGVPCTVQLLGSDAEKMAENACVAVRLGVKKIDLNFGCPAPTVNKHSGGAALLANPELIYHIVSTIKNRLPEHIVLTAKMRLGISDTQKTLDCAQAIADGGAAALTVHARTKDEQYQPPAHWEWFATIKQHIHIPVIANGDIFSVDDYRRLCQIFTPDGIMLGRGVLKNPYLAVQIKSIINNQNIQEVNVKDVLKILRHFYQQCGQCDPHGNYATARLKQWLFLLQENFSSLSPLFVCIKNKHSIDEINKILQDFQAA